MFESIQLPEIKGNLSFWLEDPERNEVSFLNPDYPQPAASVIKLSVMLAAFQCFEDGTLSPDGTCLLRREDKMPPCGVLTFLHEGLAVTWRDLVTLMIIVSDNTATNLLIDKIGIERINGTARSCGLTGLILRRKLFDEEAAARGLQNTVTARSVADFFRKLLRGELVSRRASAEMTDVLLAQQLNGKLPFYPGEDVPIAHKTGEDDGITHDAGIIFGERPVIAVFLGSETDAPAYNRYIQDAGRLLCARSDSANTIP